MQPHDIAPCTQHLQHFLQRYLPRFYRAEQRRHALLVLPACSAACNARPASRSPSRPASTASRSNFVGAGRWDDEAVMAELRRHVREELADADGVLVLDPSGFPKTGTESCGVARQWCGRLGKQDNCQVGVFLAYAAPGGYAPLDRRLYLPEDWAADASAARRSATSPRRDLPGEVADRRWTCSSGAAGPAPRLGRRRRRVGPPGEFRGLAAAPASGTCSTCRATRSVRDLERRRPPRRRRAGPQAGGAVRAGRRLGGTAAGRAVDPADGPRRRAGAAAGRRA